MKPGYEPQAVGQALGQVVEECGEVCQAIGKAMRFGIWSSNPEAPEKGNNRDQILSEIADLLLALDRAERMLFLLEKDKS